MRAKILMLSAGTAAEQAVDAAERLLSDVASAFGHTFILLRDTLAPGAPDALVNACLSADAVLVTDARAAGLSDLSDALGAALHTRVYDVPAAVAEGAKTALGVVESLDEETADAAFALAAAYVGREEAHASLVAPGGKSGAAFIERARKLLPDADVLSAPEAMTALIETPATLGFLLLPPSAGAIFLAAAASLAPYPVFLRDQYAGGDKAFFAPMMPVGAPFFSPWGLARAVADILRESLKLEREADCVEAAAQNVLAAGWRTAEIAAPGQARVDAEMIADLMSEQIELAGELLGKRSVLK